MNSIIGVGWGNGEVERRAETRRMHAMSVNRPIGSSGMVARHAGHVILIVISIL